MTKLTSCRSGPAILAAVASLWSGQALAADQLLHAQPSEVALKSYDGQPLWSVLVRCSVGYFRLSEQAKSDLVSDSEAAAARANGTTVEAQRSAKSAEYLKKAAEFRDRSVALLMADRSIDQQQAMEAIRAQLPQMQPIQDSMFSSPCYLLSKRN